MPTRALPHFYSEPHDGKFRVIFGEPDGPVGSRLIVREGLTREVAEQLAEKSNAARGTSQKPRNPTRNPNRRRN